MHSSPSSLRIVPRLAGLALVALTASAQIVPDPETVALPPVEPTAAAQPFWGVGMGLRFAKIPFAAEDDTVTDVFPLFYYEGERVFLRGIEGGVKVVKADDFALNLLARYRFFDIPREQQNEYRGDALDLGVQVVRPISENLRIEAEALSDVDGHTHAILRLAGEYTPGRWWLSPQLEARAKSEQFNSAYYGLDLTDVNAGVDFRARLKARYHVYRNMYLIGSAEAGLLDGAARRSPFVNETWEWEWYAGIGFFQEPAKDRELRLEEKSTLEAKPYWRVAQGWGSDSTIGEILMANNSTQDVDVHMTSLFYGHPLSDTFFGKPIEVYLTPGIAHHYASNDQDAATEYVLAIKFYYTLPLPWRVRIGLAEGVSYTDSITYYEQTDLDRKDYRRSRLLNYLDFSADLNLGDVFRSQRLEDLWLGVGIHHRSGIFETSSMFGRIKGGSNFNTVYLQWSM